MAEHALSIIEDHVWQGAKLRTDFFSVNSQTVLEVARTISISLVHGGKVLFCGNGGSAADAQHLAAEFVGRFQMERPPLPALSLTTDTSILTAIGNDDAFDQVFTKQVKALGSEGDVLVSISTSGQSGNVLQAMESAREKGLITVGLAGRDGGRMKDLSDFLLLVEHSNTALIQEVHISVGHLLCRLVDYYLFEAVDSLQPYI
jgi:D-sedoheptulose 7-phosphate isomerase